MKKSPFGGGPMAAVLGLALVACITPVQQKREDLMLTSRQFNSDMRWARYDEAAANFVPGESRRFLQRVQLVESELVVADEEMSSVKIGDDGNSATTLVRLQWYTHRDPVVRSTVIEQRWVHEGRWLVKSQKRVRGERFPLVTEARETNGDEDVPPGKAAGAHEAQPTPALQP